MTKRKLKSGVAYDVVVIGGGSAGISAALSAREAGAVRVCVVEAKILGGECPYQACVPAKSLLAAASFYHRVNHEAGLFGIEIGRVGMNFSKLIARQKAVIKAITGDGKRMAKLLDLHGVSVIFGTAEFVDAHTVKVGQQLLKAESFVIATGAKTVLPPVSGLTEVPYLTYETVSGLKKMPRSIAILGAGPVGTEYATFFAKLGVKTLLIDDAAHILPREDQELALLAEERLRSLGVKVLTKTKALGVKINKRGVLITLQEKRLPRSELLVESLFIATGKRPDFSSFNLEAVGLVYEGNKIVTDDYLRTSKKHIFLAGDASRNLAFTHTAHYEGKIAGHNAAKFNKTKSLLTTSLGVVPHVTFIEPEFAAVGLTTEEARELGLAFTIYRAPVNQLGRAAIDGRRAGLLKILVHKKTNQVLGAHMLGERSGEVIHELALAMHTGLSFAHLQSLIRAYPTYSELISLASPL